MRCWQESVLELTFQIYIFKKEQSKREGKKGERKEIDLSLIKLKTAHILGERSASAEGYGKSQRKFLQPKVPTVTGSSRGASISLSFKYTFPRQIRHSNRSKEAILSLLITPAMNLGSQKGRHSLGTGIGMQREGPVGREDTPWKEGPFTLWAGGTPTQLYRQESQGHPASSPDLPQVPLTFCFLWKNVSPHSLVPTPGKSCDNPSEQWSPQLPMGEQ